MHKKLVGVSIAAFAFIALFGCGSTTNVGTTPEPSKNSSGFKLSVSEDSYLYGASAAGYTLTTEERGQDVIVSINAEHATRLTALYFDLEYNPEQYRPLTVAPTEAIAPIEEMLEVTLLKDRGVVHHGQIAVRPQMRSGFSGTGTVAHVLFRKAVTPAVRTVSAPPTGLNSKTILSLAGSDLTWRYYNNGDYNQDSVVSVQDLTPIGINFQDAVTGAPDSAIAVADGNGDGVISVQDLTPIGISFQKKVSSYNVYSSEVPADYPDSGTLEGNVLQSAGLGTERKVYGFTLAAVSPTAIYWVRPADGGVDGTPSDPVGNVGLTLTLNPVPVGGNVNFGDSFTLTLTSDADGDVTLDPTVVYDVPAGVGTITVGVTEVTLDILPAAAVGPFAVSATYDSVPVSVQLTVVDDVPTGGVFIQPAVADADWTGADGSGSSADPWILGSDTFNTTYEGDNLTRTLEFSWDAFDGDDNTGTALDEGTLTWTGVFDWQITFTGTDGTFKVHDFTSGSGSEPTFVQAQDAELDLSNKVYVEVQGVPST